MTHSLIASAGELHGRAIPEWIGRTPDERPPDRVRLRVLLRYERKCYWSKATIRSDRKVLKSALPEDTAVWKEAERQLEAQRVAENRERYAHAEAPRDPGGT